MYKEINNFPKMKSDISKAFDINRILDHNYKNLLNVGLAFTRILMSTIPDGERGPQGQERPSIRLWGKRIKESFEGPVLASSGRNDSLSISVLFNHPSVDESLGGDVLSWFQHGTGGHLIPDSDTKVVFWWGSPLKWPQHGGKPGVRSSKKARQWGSSTIKRNYWAKPYGDFVEEAEDAVKPYEELEIDKAYATSVTRPLDASSYLRRVS